MTKQQRSQSFPVRKEGVAKLTGRSVYTDDWSLPEMLHGATVRSPMARGKIRGVEFEPGVPWDEFTIVTAKDVPGRNHVALIQDDQPYLADGVVNHAEEAVVLLAHRDKQLLEKARKLVHLDIEPLPAVLTITESLAQRDIIWGDDNCFKAISIEKGDTAGAFDRAAYIVEGEYETGAQEQLYIEPNGMIAVADPVRGVTIWGSLQCPYYVQKALITLFELPADKVRIIQLETGGGFGGKEEYPSVLAGHAALLALKSGCPVKMIYDRAEDMAATTKRHPSWTRHRTALDKDGRILAMDIDFVIDGGAYMTLSPVVLSRGAIHAAGPYQCAHVRIKAKAVATNTPPHGAFRGFGAPQSIFALERHMDRLAATVGLSPEEFRRKNFLQPGQFTATGQAMQSNIDLSALLDQALQAADFHNKKARFAQENAKNSRIKRGMGLACFMHGSGFTGAGEKHLASVAGVEATEQGHVRVLAASTEIGQGTNTIFTQIICDALDLPPDMVEICTPDTGRVPDSGPTVASRTCMVVGQLVETAAVSLRQMLIASGLLKTPYTPAEFAVAAKAYLAMHGSLKSYSQYKTPTTLNWDDQAYRGDAYAAFAWAVYVAEVEVDLVTYDTRVVDFVALQEVGRVVNPVLAAGQIEGGVAQAIGFALYEDVVWQDGRMINNRMTNYIMPTAADLPPIRVYFEEMACAFGPGGAKGIGELPMDGPAPAIIGAVEDATGLCIRKVPMLPEHLWRSVLGSKEGQL